MKHVGLLLILSLLLVLVGCNGHFTDRGAWDRDIPGRGEMVISGPLPDGSWSAPETVPSGDQDSSNLVSTLGGGTLVHLAGLAYEVYLKVSSPFRGKSLAP